MADGSPHWRRLAFIKVRRLFRAWLPLCAQQVLSPIIGRDQWLQLCLLIIGLWLYFTATEPVKVPEIISNLVVGAKAVSVAIPIYLVLSAITAFVTALREEKKRGKWLQAKYIYNEPRHAFTMVWCPVDNGKTLKFKFEDAEANSLVQYELQFSGLGDDRIWGMLTGTICMSDAPAFVKHAALEPIGKAAVGQSKELYLTCYSKPESLPAIVRVYILGWELFTNDGLDLTQKGIVRMVVTKPPKDGSIEALKHSGFGGI